MLPVNVIPEHELSLPSGIDIKFRQYLAKEQKLFQMAEITKDAREKASLIKQVVKNCIVSKDVNVDTLSYVDMEFLLLHLRAKSVGDPIQMKYMCMNRYYDVNEEREKTCASEMFCEVPVSEITITNKQNSGKTNLILDEDLQIGVIMQPPTFNDTVNIEVENKLNDIEKIEVLILKCVVGVFTKDEVFDTAFDKKELKEFIDNLPLYQYQKIVDYFDTIPRLFYTGNFTCPHCNFTHNLTLNKMQDFLV